MWLVPLLPAGYLLRWDHHSHQGLKWFRHRLQSVGAKKSVSEQEGREAIPLSAEPGYGFSAAQTLLNFVCLGMRSGARMESRFCWAQGKAGCRVRPAALSQMAHKLVPFTEESSYRP